MEPDAKYTLVGTAVLVLVVAIIGAVLWLRGVGGDRNDRFYKIYFERQSLEGLEPRSDVRMRGIRVGSVNDFLFSSTRPGAVEVFIRVNGSTPVRESTRAMVERHLVTGIASIRLVNATEDSPLLTEAPAGEPYPVIAEGESQLQQFSESLNQMAQRADETMRRINATLSPENQKAFAEILENVRRLSADAQRVVTATGGAADEVRRLARTVTADVQTLSARYDALGEQAQGSLQEFNAMIRDMREDAARLATSADRLMASGDVELRATAQSLRRAADALGVAADQLRDPRGAIFGPPESALGPGEGGR